MKIKLPALIFALFFISAIGGLGIANAEILYFTIDKAIEYASKNDLKLNSLKLSLNDLLKSKLNLYRSLFPELKANASWQKVTGVGEADTSSYTVGFSLEEILYNQLSTPMKFDQYRNSIKKARLDVQNRENEIEQNVMGLYLTIIFGERRLKNSEEKISIYKKLVNLMNVENRLGSKTIMDVVEAEKKLLEARLNREELAENIRVTYRDLINLLSLNNENVKINIDTNTKNIFKKVMGVKGETFPNSIEGLVKYIGAQGSKVKRKDIYRKAVNIDFELRKMRISLKNNSIKRKLLGILWLKNVSVTAGVNFTGEKFFPVNRTYSVGAAVLFDFGYFAPNVSVSKSGLPANNTTGGSGESELFNDIKIVKKREQLNIEAYSVKKKMENRIKKIKRDIDVWFIKYESLIKKYEIFKKQERIVKKNSEIFRIKLDIGEIKPIDYLQFEAEKKDFELKMDELSRDLIKLIWEFELISGMSITELAGLS